MASEYRQIFPSELVFENMKWRLIYDPANPVMVKPDLSHSKVIRYTCDAVKLSGQDNPFYLATLNIVIPAQTLFNLLIGQAYEESKKQDEIVDRTWGHDLLCAATEPEQASEGNES